MVRNSEMYNKIRYNYLIFRLKLIENFPKCEKKSTINDRIPITLFNYYSNLLQ